MKNLLCTGFSFLGKVTFYNSFETNISKTTFFFILH